ncbi:hypothetical protein [Xenorhabdus ishibashii]|uniref:Transcriptional regulator n=1 Tax=Xenorhabdus ishibashii TaxID=1034471 RepID=A0A2D0K7V4_9GAMM|nr:hypothetical protein [Xenorhabdus ishibashii]PHM59524.1 hypothetical protein Xish_03643 [Xenorhabdus ishibashii]
MINPKDVHPKDLVFFQRSLSRSDQDMADMLGISAKTWINKRSSTSRAIRKQLLSPAECEYFMLLTGNHSQYYLTKNNK